MTNATLLNQALVRIDAANAEDPHQEIFEGKGYPKELLYAQRMSVWLEKIEPNASETLKLAVRSQHIQRWKIPRNQYSMDKKGYKDWRTACGKMHGDITGKILQEVGYDPRTIQQVQSLLVKEDLKKNAECQLLEDVICLVFLEFYFSDFAKQHDEEKLIGVIRKTWKKMSPRGHQAALGLSLPTPLRTLVEKALTQK